MKTILIPKNKLAIKAVAIELALNYLYWVTLAMIILSSIFYYLDGYFGGDLGGIKYRVDNLKLIIFSFIYIAGLHLSYWLSVKEASISLYKVSPVIKNRKVRYTFFLIFSLVVVLCSVVGGEGTIHRNVETSRYAQLFFAFFDPYMVMVLSIYYIFLEQQKKVSSKIMLVYLILIYLFLAIRSGFTGLLIPLLPVFITFLLKFLSRRKVVLTLVLSVFLFPFIRLGKWFLVMRVDDFSSALITKELIQMSARGVVERFSAIPNMIYINDSLYNRDIFLQTSYLPFFQGYLGSLYHKVFFSGPVSLNTLLLHQTIQDTSSDSNSTFPVFSYFSLDFFIGLFSFFYVLILVFLSSQLLNFIFGKERFGKMLSTFFLFFVTFFYAFNGWLWALWGVIQALLIFSVFLLLTGGSRNAYSDHKL